MRGEFARARYGSKCSEEREIEQERIIIRFGDLAVYPDNSNLEVLDQLKTIMTDPKVRIHVSLNIGEASATVWGCYLSE
ncbi:MAG: hypothetical protein SAK29_37300, partial [Scytonema sp. PMC 1069.18]|nr:hypothetical protein [Scytonema sp. PMC 1069.18]